MAGHSKWNNIKRKKEKTDTQRAKIFTKMGREISVAVREGGKDPAANGKLREIIAKAKSLNVPGDNIERAIKKAGSDKAEYEQILYEGYGPSGVAVIVECLSDNRNRTAGDLRHYFDKYGGNLGQSGCVGFLFERKGLLLIANTTLDESKLMEDCLEAGALDFEIGIQGVEITSLPDDVGLVRESLEAKGYVFDSAQAHYIPASYVELDAQDIVRMEKLLEMLESSDDVQEVWHNWET